MKDATTIMGLAAAFAVLGYLNIQDVHRFGERRIAVAEECTAKVIGHFKSLIPNDADGLEQRMKELDAMIMQEVQRVLRHASIQECQKILQTMETPTSPEESELIRQLELQELELNRELERLQRKYGWPEFHPMPIPPTCPPDDLPIDI